MRSENEVKFLFRKLLLPVVSTKVYSQTALPCTFIRAVCTLKGFLPGVCTKVYSQIALLCTFIRAVCTLKGLLPGVCTKVSSQIALLCTFIRAVCTLKGLLPLTPSFSSGSKTLVPDSPLHISNVEPMTSSKASR